MPEGDNAATQGGPGRTTPADTLAEKNWMRYRYGVDRGHREYLRQARRCEGFYLGAGEQWRREDKEALAATGNRPWYEFNEVMPAVNAALGYQIHQRMDIAFLPRGGRADAALAKIRSKVAKQICDRNGYQWVETQVFSDGLIEQRGYFDVRMTFDKNVYGDVLITSIDPRDGIPDPDAKSYDPKDWADWLVTRWYTLDEIEGLYGKEARSLVLTYLDDEGDWGEQEDDGVERNKFGAEGSFTRAAWDYSIDELGTRRYRVLDRQQWVYKMTKVIVYPTGEVKPVENVQPEQLKEYLSQGAFLSRRMYRTVRWTVTTRFATLHDETSPYDRFTVIPYFCYFRRGRTRGMVDNAISPQEVLNKAVSQFIHIINTTANSGWIVEDNSLVNYDSPEDLQQEGSKTGILIVFRKGTTPPIKIEPNKAPQGMVELIDLSRQACRSATVDLSLRGLDDKEESGLARQTQQFAAQQSLAIPLDNLARTRFMVGDALNYHISNFYDNHRIFRLTENDPVTGKIVDNSFEVNRFDPVTKMWSNDMTEGEYDIVVTSMPMQVVYENSQFQQAKELKELGVNIPDNVLIEHSNLADKDEILEQMSEAAPEVSPLDEAKTKLLEAQALLARTKADQSQSETVESRVTSLFSAAQAAQAIAMTPEISPLADALARSAGFVDQDAPPIVPALSGPAIAPTQVAGKGSIVQGGPEDAAAPSGGIPTPQPNTSPAFPPKLASPAKGLNKGIEGGGDSNGG